MQKIIKWMSRQATKFLEIDLSVYSSKLLSYSIGYKTAFMTSAKQLLHSIKFRHGGYIPVNHTKFYVELKTEMNDQFPLHYILNKLLNN